MTDALIILIILVVVVLLATGLVILWMRRRLTRKGNEPVSEEIVQNPKAPSLKEPGPVIHGAVSSHGKTRSLEFFSEDDPVRSRSYLNALANHEPDLKAFIASLDEKQLAMIAFFASLDKRNLTRLAAALKNGQDIFGSNAPSQTSSSPATDRSEFKWH